VFSKVFISTSKSANKKVVKNFQEHFSSNWRHSKFWVEDAQNLSQRQDARFFWVLHWANFNSRSQPNHAWKHMLTFTKVVAWYTSSNFCIWSFWTSVEIFGVIPSQTGVDHPQHQPLRAPESESARRATGTSCTRTTVHCGSHPDVYATPCRAIRWAH
jgi:hypothetical protein